MDQGDPFLPALDPASPVAAEAAATARELVTAYLAHDDDPAMLRVVLRTALTEIYDGLSPSTVQTERAASMLCSLVALLQVALSGVGHLATADAGEELEVAQVFEQLAATAIDDGLTF